MKRRVKKPTVAEGSRYLAACRNEPCYLRVPGVCRLNPNDETVVPAHSNESAHGKGMGIKAKHEFTVPACFACHAWLDSGSAWHAEKVTTWRKGFALWEPVRARKLGLQEVSA